MGKMKKLWHKFKHKAPSQPAVSNPTSSDVATLSTALSAPIEVSANDLRGRLWNEAFDGLESVDADTFRRYKEILLEQLQDAPSDPVSATDGEIRPANNGRWRQMEQLVEIGLQRTDKSSTIKASISDKVKVLTPFKELIGSAVKASPEASVAWVGISFALEILVNPLKAPSDNRKGLTEVVSNMEWYWGLSKLLLEKDNAGPEFEELRSQLEKNIVQLYQKLLLYQMKSVCRFFKSEARGVVRDFFQGDDWNGQLDDIKAARAAVEQRSKEYNSQRLCNTLNVAASTAKLQHEKLVELLGAIELHNRRQEETQQDRDDKKCLNDLFQTDPRNDKNRIQQIKGGLLRDCYDRILDHPDYKHFWTDDDMRLFWIKGDPGKGKTMLMCGIVDELKEKSFTRLSWFFCQATQGNLSNATAVLRGLIYKLADENRSLIQQYIRKTYDAGGKQRFEDQNAWQVFTSILKEILQSDIQDGLVLVVDALDECETGGWELLSFIIEMSRSSRAKWIISSRKEPFVQDQMEESLSTTALQLELTGAVVSDAVDIYIREKVDELQRKKKYDQSTREELEQKLIKKSNDTFLWVALVCQQLERDIGRKKDPFPVLDRLPSSLTKLYQQMMQRILSDEDEERREQCKAILRVISIVYRRITLKELASIVESLTPFQDDDEVLERQVTFCGSFFEILDGTVYFVHQSAKEYLLEEAYGDLQLPDIEHQLKPAFWRSQHHVVLQRALERLGKTLKRDICGLQDDGITIDEVCSETSKPLALVEYFCNHWIDHLLDSRSSKSLEDHVQGDDDLVLGFLQEKFLFWVEALSLLKNLPNGVSSMSRLDNLLAHSTSIRLSELIRDTFRFILRHRTTIELAPLQTYASALAFSPTESVVRTLFQDQEPAWITAMPPVEATWSACMQTLDGHDGIIRSLATSKDGRWLASASQDRTVRLWDAVSGACLQTYCDCCPESNRSHIFRRGDKNYHWTDGIGSVAFSDDSQHLASVSWDGFVRIWNVARGLCIRKIECDKEQWFSITYPSDNHWITLASPSQILILDAVTGACLRSHEPKDGERCGYFYYMAYSPDGKWLASGSFYPDGVVMIWDTATGALKQKFGTGAAMETPRKNSLTGSMSFSHDSQLLATSFADGAIKLWDMEKVICVKTFESHRNRRVYTIAFSSDGQWLVSATGTSIEVWDLEKGTPFRAFKDYGYQLGIMTLSVDGQRLFSTSSGNAIKVWDLRVTYTQNTENDRGPFDLLTCSINGQYIASYDWAHTGESIEIRDVYTNACREIRIRQKHRMEQMKLSADGQLLMITLRDVESGDMITELWHVQSGECTQTFKGFDGDITLSPNSQLFALVRLEYVQIWRVSSRECLQTLNMLDDPWPSVAFSPDGRWFASASSQKVRLWSTANYECAQTLTLKEGYSPRLAFSKNSCWLGVAAHDDSFYDESKSISILQIWDTATVAHTQSFKIRDTYHNRFDEHFFTHLVDALGPLSVDSIAKEPHTLVPSEIIYGGLQLDDNWITRGGKRVLRIPPGYQTPPSASPDEVAIAGSFLAWLSHDGRLFWIRFSEE